MIKNKGLKLAGLALVMCFLWVGIGRAEEKAVSGIDKTVVILKSFDWSAGSYLYRFGAKTHNIGIGFSKPIKTLDNWISIDAGKLFPIDEKEKDRIEKDVYLGVGFNLGRATAECIEWTCGKFGWEVLMPTWLKENVLKTGFVGIADPTNLFKKDGWDCAGKVDVISIKF